MIRQIALVISFPAFLSAQTNLVRNPGFERYKKLPCMPCNRNSDGIMPGMSNFVYDWTTPLPDIPTADYMNNLSKADCFASARTNLGEGIRTPHNGHGMIWLAACSPLSDDGRDYISETLANPLEKGKRYYAEMYVSLAPRAGFAVNSLGLLFYSDQPVNKFQGYNPSRPHIILADPQVRSTTIVTDTTSWVKVCGTFVADDNYKCVAIGIFESGIPIQWQIVQPGPMGEYHDNAWASYYIDDILVKEISSSAICNCSEPSRPVPDSLSIATLNGREVKTAGHVIVHNENIRLSVYDNSKIDGDTISLYYGDSCLVNRLGLSRTKTTFNITVDKINFRQLILYANNLGTMPPNTAACIISDGKNEINVELSSDLKSSQAMLIEYVPDN